MDTRDPIWSLEIIDRLKVDIEKTKPSHLIILGDLEHSFSHYRKSKRVRGREKIWVTNKWVREKVFSYFIEQIVENSALKIILLRGNQDIAVLEMLDTHIEIYPAKGTSLFNNQLGAFHGHVKPTENVLHSSEIFIGHVHPAIELIDELNIRHRIPVFTKLTVSREDVFKLFKLQLDLDELIDFGLIDEIQINILPTYNNYLSGYALNTKKRKSSKSYPVLSSLIQHPQLRVQMTDGVDLGLLANI
ncbi:MAG: hypothetical protein ACXAC8_11075 [Candidatus Hodarchaeales archaeon]